ncbi:hypothetical protein T4B_4854 [Trichinella pseudospiralis]|uniref:Uncharacterized protein n=2 Tax=Trichinella pseudospiralis TaxID=6337 RepID=A0A0V0XVM9_TRIPS|nr:hypothetical protein T4E_2219 [Trichinella pseudospiralis]KRY73750.1 hypothetical protein T4A_12164 [Trichinella pseudospiralis]KRY84528.1 hypothetical protein T4D_2502 [Trichinella pseudospiralis]KRZ25212.1 hypothetical protein T4B_4854 [Trichinella pseudospiralis]KRZ40121.1 hypothetical protein T4C_12877 [Trichinella pseudospiralis]
MNVRDDEQILEIDILVAWQQHTSLPVWLSRYHYCYDVGTHKRKQPCTEPADPQYMGTLKSESKIDIFGGIDISEC